MSGVNETLVREFFEARGFLVRQQRKFSAPGLQEDDAIDFHVLNARRREPRADLPTILTAEDTDGLAAAAVAVRGWHTEIFSAALLAHEPDVARFTDAEQVAASARALGLAPPLTRVLVVPSLPETKADRDQAVALLRAKGVDALLPFRAVLADLIQRAEVNRNYAKSDVLQILRILKNYDLLKEPALELFRPRRKSR
jgi:hypothetical protein